MPARVSRAAPVDVPALVFAQRWQQVAGAPFKVDQALGSGAPSRGATEALLAALGLKLLPAMDHHGEGLSAACVFHCGSGATLRQVPCMVRVTGLGSPTPALAVATADAAATDALKRALVGLLLG